MQQVPVAFRCPKAMLPLPTPVVGGSVYELSEFVNVEDEQWPLLVAWLVASLRPVGPYPVLSINDEHGSGKSTQSRAIRALVDPNSAPVRCEPRNPHDLAIVAHNSWCVVLDNLSKIPLWLSDAICRLATGGGFSTLEL